MDARHFDTLTRSLSEAGTRRGLLGLLTALPLLGGLVALLDVDETDAKGRRKRRKKRHKHGKGRRRKHHKKACKPKSLAKTCAGKCGLVKNNCKKAVDCGSCDCDPPCDECRTCQAEPGAPGTCVPQDAGTPCGKATCENGTATPQGQCDSAGACLPGTPASCDPYTQCDGTACAETCASDDDCVADAFCNSEGHCAGDQDNGQPCEHGGDCLSSFCVDGVCCDTGCDGACQACNLQGNKGTCITEENGSTCGGENICCAGSCQECCDSDGCPGTRPFCLNGTCEPCSEDPEACPNGACCNADSGACITTCPAGAPICDADNVCAPCETDGECGTDALCVDGQCHACDVVAGENLADAIGGAAEGATLYVCAGTYTSTNINLLSLIIIGAGQGAEGTVIQAPLTLPAVPPSAGSLPVTLRTLRVQNSSHIRIAGGRLLTMIDCTVRGNSASHGAGILNDPFATLEMTRCTVENNTVDGGIGGGLHNDGGSATLTDCQFVGNAATRGGGIYNDVGALTLSGTLVANNSASNGGSGIFSNGGTVTLQDDSSVCANNPTADQCHGFADPGGACSSVCPG